MRKNGEPKRDCIFRAVADGYLELGLGLVQMFGRLGRHIHGGVAFVWAASALVLAGTFL
jgi:hypothetical protein